MATVTPFHIAVLLVVVGNLSEALIVPTLSFSQQNGVTAKRTRLGMSVLGPLDIATSGLASIARLPFGTIVVQSDSREDLTDTFSIKVLYDTEESNDCRSVRERITELDLNVEVVGEAQNKCTYSEAYHSKNLLHQY